MIACAARRPGASSKSNDKRISERAVLVTRGQARDLRSTVPMATKTTTALETPLRNYLDALAAFEPADAPVLSLYLDMRPDSTGSRHHCAVFLRQTFGDHSRALKGNVRKSFDRDAERIERYIAEDVSKSTNGLAVFACADRSDFFEAIQLDVPIARHEFFVGAVPHIYPLARLNDQYPRYAALLVDTNSARLFVFGLGLVEQRETIRNPKTRRTAMGGWSQARYQRHADNFHKHHIKEVVDVLDRVVADEHLNHIVVSCDEVARPVLTEQLPKHLSEKVIDIAYLDVKVTPEHDVLRETMEALRQEDAKTDAEHVEQMLGAWRAGGLGVAGPEPTLQALMMGQVEELLITNKPDQLKAPKDRAKDARLDLPDDLVAKAQQQNGARIRFIEDEKLLADVGGVGALLRFKI
jgi:peptide subunit release factor 1 (eRF1)